jgi:hypothetical protein
MYLGLLTIVDDYRHVPGRAMLFDNWHEGQLRNNKRMRLLWLLVWLACMGVLIQQVSLTGPREVWGCQSRPISLSHYGYFWILLKTGLQVGYYLEKRIQTDVSSEGAEEIKDFKFPYFWLSHGLGKDSPLFLKPHSVNECIVSDGEKSCMPHNHGKCGDSEDWSISRCMDFLVVS